jgi:tryptophanyl-tRNA synthetase
VVHSLYKLIASPSDAERMAEQLRAGGYGWGHAKKDLLEAIVDGFADERANFSRWMADTAALDTELHQGAVRARGTASEVLARVRSKFGY